VMGQHLREREEKMSAVRIEDIGGGSVSSY
jgi:hypothetical protein